jgi:sugar lactone lactonase YvrE
MPPSADGTLLHGPDNTLQYIYADQLEISPDGHWLYYQPCSGGMSRIETRQLNDAFYSSSLRYNLTQNVELYAATASTGGTAIDSSGNIYISDTDRRAIQKISPNGTITTLIQDSRLAWVDAMWIDVQGRLLMPAAQLNHGIPFNNGTNGIVKPIHIFSMDIGIKPSPIDHA